MIALPFTLSKTGGAWRVSLLLLLYAVPAAVLLKNYIRWDSPVFLLGLLTLFITTGECTDRPGSLRYGIAAMLTGIITCFFPIKTLFFYFTAFSMFYIVERLRGHLNFLSLASLVLLSPLFSHFILQFGFTIRLYLTACAGFLLKFIVPDTLVSGNIITMNGVEYAVDPACMGLNMMVTSLISGVLLIALFQERRGKQLHITAIILSLLLIVTLNILCNLIRIMILTYYNILPGNTLHDITGLICFLVYVILPAGWLINRLTGKAAIPDKRQATVRGSYRAAILLQVLLFCTFLSVCIIMQRRPPAISFNYPVAPGEYSTTVLAEKGVFKMEHENALVYIKPIPNCYTGEHHPVFCWTGSGYTFTKIKLNETAGFRFYTAQLEKEKDLLYTAWWYDNGYRNTTEQWQWRWDMLKGNEPYALINITTATEQELEKEIHRFNQSVTLKELWNREQR
ncbi:MAG: exosortase N [Chitinophagaceae bacterium]|nr:exosortase N [Chitinophagaceae bacterium]MCW5928495.1 exosortase N [Chitinophagaceae bacterium]